MGEEREQQEPDREGQDPSAATREAETDPPDEGKEHDLEPRLTRPGAG